MADEDYEKALEAARNLTEKSDEALFEELGLRLQDVYNMGGYKRAQEYKSEYAQEAQDMLSTADLKEFGSRWWKKLQPEIMTLVCDEKNEEFKQITGGKTIPQMAAALATWGLFTVIAGPPSWAVVLASIVATKVAETGLDALCELWQESLEAGSARNL